jgi:hypothetical protein
MNLFVFSSRQVKIFQNRIIFLVFSFLLSVPLTASFKPVYSQALNFPTKTSGISIGNSKVFNGLRINFRDRNVDRINGINLTVWNSGNNKKAVVKGLSLGGLPEAGVLQGIQIGIVGAAAESEVRGISFGLLGVGSGGKVCGVGIGGLGVGANELLKGIFIGGLGVGSGGEIKGIALGLLGTGAGGDITGITLGGLGAGGGGNIRGITIGGLGAGASGDVTGIIIGGLGAGAGGNVRGITIGGVGAGCGEELQGIAMGGIGVGAPLVKGVALSVFAAGGDHLQGIMLAGGWVRVSEGGSTRGITCAAFNQIKGEQNGLSLGIVNYTRSIKGLQIGLINIVQENPRFLRILPILNFHF